MGFAMKAEGILNETEERILPFTTQSKAQQQILADIIGSELLISYVIAIKLEDPKDTHAKLETATVTLILKLH